MVVLVFCLSIGVFYCGAHGLGEELKHLSEGLSRERSAKFEFHIYNYWKNSNNNDIVRES